MGAPGRRRPSPLREAVAGSVSIRAELADHSRQARELPEGFAGFDIDRIAGFTEEDVARLLADEGIVRHRGKIEAVIDNARRARAIVAEFGSLAAFIWRYEPTAGELAAPQTASTSTTSVALSKELKRRGWRFVGPTTIHAFMQAMGLINDHVEGCASRAEAEHSRKAFRRPIAP